MTQSWHNLLFAHWPVAPAALAHLVPAPLEIDTFDGQAWVGVVAFRLDHIRLRGLPEVPFVCGFAEINVRTYVRLGERRGVLFLSLDTDHLLTIGMARPWFHLPYQFARMDFAATYGGVRVGSKRPGESTAEFRAEYWPLAAKGAAAPDSLESWLTERYCYFAPVGAKIYRCDIAHQPWRLQRAGAAITRNTMLESHGITTPTAAPLLHYANFMKALIWPVQRVATEAATQQMSPVPSWS